ncbi:hypothetical protein [Mycoplasmopsis cynos]|uniref:hypothetical protein n=1 Tax=Mycoplasmopsis cynos TaxID=171284 RepID=UPI0024C91E67|nr:hypothetical protein [Mycoplasmopsis cynos]WAM05172.1 hypothetical protein ONA01_03520 [Mycoplasmopsis cynos]
MLKRTFRKYAYENLTEITVSDISVLINVIKSKYKEVEKLFKELNISWFKNIESFDTDDINKTTDLRKSYNHLCEIKRIMNSLNLLSFKWEENGKLMPFDQEVAKRIDVKIYEIGSILANIDSTNCGDSLDDDLKFYNDEVLRDIQDAKSKNFMIRIFSQNLNEN